MNWPYVNVMVCFSKSISFKKTASFFFLIFFFVSTLSTRQMGILGRLQDLGMGGEPFASVTNRLAV